MLSLLLECAGVGPFLNDPQIFISLLTLSIISLFINELLASQIAVFFFPRFGLLLETLFFFNRFLGFLADSVADLFTFPLVILVSLLVLFSLNVNHFFFLWSFAVHPLLNLFLVLGTLIVQVLLECLLKVSLLGKFVLFINLLHLVLMSHDSTPFVEYFLFGFDRQVPPFRNRTLLRCHRRLLSCGLPWWTRDGHFSRINAISFGNNGCSGVFVVTRYSLYQYRHGICKLANHCSTWLRYIGRLQSVRMLSTVRVIQCGFNLRLVNILHNNHNWPLNLRSQVTLIGGRSHVSCERLLSIVFN